MHLSPPNARRPRRSGSAANKHRDLIIDAGFLNGYARIADREDLNFLLHLGDYIYEASQNPPAPQTKSKDIGRPFDPLHECVTTPERPGAMADPGHSQLGPDQGPWFQFAGGEPIMLA